MIDSKYLSVLRIVFGMLSILSVSSAIYNVIYLSTNLLYIK